MKTKSLNESNFPLHVYVPLVKNKIKANFKFKI